RARYDVSSMRTIIMAAAPCPMSVKEAVIAYFGPALYEFYGSTELAVNTILRPEDVLRKPGSCGQAAPGREIALLDDDGRPVPAVGWGGRVHAAVQLQPGVRLTAEDVMAFARRHVAGYKVPREVSFHEDFPRDAAGKLLKRVLREPYWAGRAVRI